MTKSTLPQRPKKISAIDAYWIPAPPGIKGFGIKVFRKLRQFYRKAFQDKSYIFMHSGPFTPPVNPPCKFARYNRFDDIPDSVKEAILVNEGNASLDNNRFEMEHGATMWVGLVDGKLAHTLFSRYGKDFKRWFVELQDEDIVIFRGRTYPEYRSLGIQGAVLKHIMNTLLKNGNKAHVDCSIHNISSMRSILKAGFVIVAKMKSITRKQALGVDQ